MLNAADLARVLPTLTPQTRQGHGYRIVDYQYFAALPNLHPVRILYGFGASMNGQRFTPRGGMATIYFAEDLATAFDEVHPEKAIIRQRDPGLVLPVSPGGFAAIQYRIETVLDATDPAVQQTSGTDTAELTGHWRQARKRGQPPPHPAARPGRLRLRLVPGHLVRVRPCLRHVLPCRLSWKFTTRMVISRNVFPKDCSSLLFPGKVIRCTGRFRQARRAAPRREN